MKGAVLSSPNQADVNACGTGGRRSSICPSALSRHAYPTMIAYSMGKAAINHFTLILAAELGKRGITVNAIAPA